MEAHERDVARHDDADDLERVRLVQRWIVRQPCFQRSWVQHHRKPLRSEADLLLREPAVSHAGMDKCAIERVVFILGGSTGMARPRGLGRELFQRTA